MAGDAKKCRSPRQSVAVLLFLFSLAPSLTCFSLRGLSEKAQPDEVSDAAEKELRTGRVFFNGKELNSTSSSSSAAAVNNGFAHVDSFQSDSAGKRLPFVLNRVSQNMLESDWNCFPAVVIPLQAVQKESAMASEAAWWRMNPTLHCGLTNMKLKVMGYGANDLQLLTGIVTKSSLSQASYLYVRFKVFFFS